MTAIKLNTIDFNSSKIAERSQEVKISGEMSEKTLAYALRWQLARKRAGTAKVKLMSEISGTTAKPYKQKGTGNARHGSRRSVQFVGGRTCHGPTPRSFDFALPKKMVTKALKDAITFKLEQGDFITYDNTIKEVKTSILNNTLKVNNITSALIICDLDDENNKNLILSARNIKNIKVIDLKGINSYDLLKFAKIIVDTKTFEEKIIKSL